MDHDSSGTEDLQMEGNENDDEWEPESGRPEQRQQVDHDPYSDETEIISSESEGDNDSGEELIHIDSDSDVPDANVNGI